MNEELHIKNYLTGEIFMNLKRIIQLTGVAVCILLLVVWCGSAFSMSSGISSTSSSGGFSSSSSSSSNLGFSTSTLVMTGGTPSKPAGQQTSGGPGTIPANEIIPPQWKPGTRSGTFSDPITQTNWFFDNVLQKFYSPTYGWFLITQYTKEGKMYAQFYYDPKSGVFIDMKTGGAIMNSATPSPITGPSGQQGQQTGTTPPPAQTISPYTGASPIVAAGQSPTVPSSTATHPCRIICTSCPSGFCDDCNQNGVCDDSESSGTIVAGAKPDTQTGGVSEEPQTPIQINLPITPSGTSSGVSAEGGLSETPQSTINYLKSDLIIPQSGIRSIGTCDPNQDCEYCLDIDDDGTCTMNDYAIILCNEKWGLDYMGSRNNICDSDILLIMNCSEPSECTFAEFCMDSDGNGQCDEELTKDTQI